MRYLDLSFPKAELEIGHMREQFTEKLGLGQQDARKGGGFSQT